MKCNWNDTEILFHGIPGTELIPHCNPREESEVFFLRGFSVKKFFHLVHSAIPFHRALLSEKAQSVS